MRRVPSQSYGASPATWDHTVLPATRHKWTHLALTLASKLVLDLSTLEGCWVDLGYSAMHQPGVELAISQSQIRRPNHYTTEPPTSALLDNVACSYVSFLIIPPPNLVWLCFCPVCPCLCPCVRVSAQKHYEHDILQCVWHIFTKLTPVMHYGTEWTFHKLRSKGQRSRSRWNKVC